MGLLDAPNAFVILMMSTDEWEIVFALFEHSGFNFAFYCLH